MAATVIEFAPALNGLAGRFPPGVRKAQAKRRAPKLGVRNRGAGARGVPMGRRAPKVPTFMAPRTAGGLGDLGLPSWLRAVGRAVDPTKKDSLTYGVASQYVGAQNLQTAAAIGRGVRDQVIGGGIAPAPTSQQGAAGGQQVQRQGPQQPGAASFFVPQNTTQKVLLGGAGVLGILLVVSIVRRRRG
jgi:hypothetical protein